MPGTPLTPPLGEAHHHGFLVEDIEATVGRLAEQLGAGPFFLVEDVQLGNLQSGGEPAEWAHSSAFGYCGGGPVELTQTVRMAPDRVEKAFSGPRPRLHHIAYAVPAAAVAELRGELDRRGMPTYLSAQTGDVDNTFHDASALLGHDLEIHVDSEEFRGLFEMVSSGAEGWDGSDPLRVVGD